MRSTFALESSEEGKEPAKVALRSWTQKLRAQLQRPGGTPHIWAQVALALFVSLAVLTVPMSAPDLGVDSSWCGVLDWAHHHEVQFGRDIVFTYGPLGYLVTPYTLKPPTEGLILVNAVLCFAASLGLCLVGSRLSLLWRCALVATFVFEAANADLRADIVMQVGLFCWALLCFLELGRGRAICIAALGLFGGFVSLTKVLYLFAGSVSVCAVICMLLAMRRWRLGLLLALVFTGTLLLAWVGCGQEIANLSSFVANSFRFSREYDQAASLQGVSFLRSSGLLLLITSLCSIVLYAFHALRSSYRNRRAGQVVLFMWVTVMVLMVAKHSLVRLDRSHFMELAVFAPAVALALRAVSFEPDRSFNRQEPSHPTLPKNPLSLLATVTAVICAVCSLCIVDLAFLPGIAAGCRQLIAQCEYHTRLLLAPTGCLDSFQAGLEARRSEAQLPAARKIIGQATVDVFGFHQAHALLNELNYHPRPVFQSYAAYSLSLARLNEKFYQSQRAPQYVLFELSALEHRFPALDDSLALRELLMNCQYLAQEGPFLLLKRKPAESEKLTLVDQGTTTLAQPINLSQHSAENLWIEIEIEPSLVGRIMQVYHRPSVIRLSIWGDSPNGIKLLARRQAGPSPLKTGFLVSPFLVTTDAARDFLLGQAVLRPAAISLEAEAHSESLWKSQIRFRLYRVENPMPIPPGPDDK